MSTEPVSFEVTDGIAEIRFDRADKHNSLTLDMFEAIAAAGAALREHPAVRVAVLSGNGPSFCAGLDFSLMRGLLGTAGDGNAVTKKLLGTAGDGNAVTKKLLGRADGPENLAQRVAYTWKTAPVPVIAAIHGVAFGGGFQIAMGCDIRIAAPTARFSIMEMRYGLIPDMSITQTLPELLGRDVALELTLSAREFDAVEAKTLGLVTRLADDPLAAAHALATDIAARSPEAVRACKRLYNEAWRSDAAHGLALEERLQLELIGSRNQREAVSASLEKRAPEFAEAGS